MTDHRRECSRCRALLSRGNATGTCAPCKAQGADGPHEEMPPHFWREPRMLAALRGQHFGRVIRAYRHHPEHGGKPLTQSVVGKWLGLSQEQLSRIENGPPIVHLDRLIAWAQILRIPAEHLWFAVPSAAIAHGGASREIAVSSPYMDTSSPSAMWSVSTVDAVSEFTREDLALDRRAATKTITGLVLGTALLEPLERWLFGPTEILDARHGGPSGCRERIGYQELEQIEHAAKLFRTWDDKFGGGLRRKAVIGQLNEVPDLIGDARSPEMRRRLFAVMGQLAETAALMSWDSGRQSAAQHYYALALRASRTAGDVLFAANVLAGMARQLLYLGHPADALELVRLGQDLTRGIATPTIRSLLHTREAWAYAAQGRVSAFRRATAMAQEEISAAKDPFPGAEDPYWIEYFDVSEFSGTTGGRLLELAHRDTRLASEAAGYIQKAIELRRSGRLRSSALDQLGLAETRLVQGELEEAAKLGIEAADVVERTPSMRVRVKLAELYEYSTAQRKVRAIGDFRERARPLLTSST
jgi:transcriptional regulator with XRE-family HTH domain